MTMTADDKVNIHELSSRYALAMDENDLAGWINTWSEDGTWEGARGTYVGHTRLSDLLADLGDRVRNKRHVISNNIIEGDAVQATQICYMLIYEAKQGGTLVATAVYRDRLKKTAGTWKFTHRKMKLDV